MTDFNSWKEYEGASEGSGRSEKIWLVDSASNMIGLFKYPKSLLTTEYFSEKLASELGRKIGIDCAKVDIGI